MRSAISTAVLAFAGTLSWAGCAHVGHEAPAVIVNPTAESRAEILSVVSRALHGRSPTLADDALTRESTLIIERVQPRDAAGVPLTGRDTGRPEQFRLVKDGSRCVLVHEGSGKRWTLASATCVARE